MEVVFLKDHGDKYRDEFAYIIHYAFRGWARKDAYKFWDELNAGNTPLGAVENGELMSVLNIEDFSAYLYGATVPMGGVGAVATLGTARGKGAAAACLKQSVRTMYEKGYVLSALAPFSFDFYRKFGWESVYDTGYITLDIQDICGLSYDKGGFYLIKNKDEYPVLKEIYDRNTKAFNGCTKRNEKHWKGMFDEEFDRGDKTVVVYKNSDDVPEAYAVFSIEDTVMRMSEIMYDSINGLKALLSYAAAHTAPCRTVELQNLPMPYDVLDVIPSKRVKISMCCGMMQRIINVQKALASYRYTCDGEVKICVADDILEENCGVFSIKAENGKAVSVAKTDGDFDIKIDIRELAQLLTGYRNIDELARLGKAEVKNKESSGFFMTKNITVIYDSF